MSGQARGGSQEGTGSARNLDSAVRFEAQSRGHPARGAVQEIRGGCMRAFCFLCRKNSSLSAEADATEFRHNWNPGRANGAVTRVVCWWWFCLFGFVILACTGTN